MIPHKKGFVAKMFEPKRLAKASTGVAILANDCFLFVKQTFHWDEGWEGQEWWTSSSKVQDEQRGP